MGTDHFCTPVPGMGTDPFEGFILRRTEGLQGMWLGEDMGTGPVSPQGLDL